MTSSPNWTVPRDFAHHGYASLSVGFATAVAMWIVGYLTHIPIAPAPRALSLLLFAACLVGGGMVLGKREPQRFRLAVYAAGWTVLINLMVLGALLAEGTGPSPLIWIPGYALVSVLLMAIGWQVGKRRSDAAMKHQAGEQGAAGIASPASSEADAGGGAAAKDASAVAREFSAEHEASGLGRDDAPGQPDVLGQPDALGQPDVLGQPVAQAHTVALRNLTNWRSWLAWATVAACALVVVAGGLVTGFDAGFAVPDWPTSFGANMFLFPLSRMVGGIYYEHAHRLAGTLLGLCAMAWLIEAWLLDRRLWFKWLITAAFVLVCIQGIAGGIWVETASLAYILFHGTFGQVILGLFTAAAVMTTGAFFALKNQRQLGDARPAATDAVADSQAAQRISWDRHINISIDRQFVAVLLIMLVAQTAMGVVLRKTDDLLIHHIVGACVVTILAYVTGPRAWALLGKHWAGIRRLGIVVTLAMTAQIVFGLTALIARDGPAAKAVEVGDPAVSSTTDAVITTLHQSTGALLLAASAALATMIYRWPRYRSV